MGEHGSWFDFFYGSELVRDLHVGAQHELGRDWQALIFTDTHFAIDHIFWTLVVLLVITIGALKFFASVRKQDGIVPDKKFGFRSFIEMFTDATYGLMVQVMGEKDAKKHLPLIGSMAIFIFFCNILALLPGGAVPTSTLKTNALLAVLVFFAYNIYGFAANKGNYLKHFAGPIWWLAPLMLPIELIGHFARPVSLALRLMGNMAADHKVLFTFTFLVPLLIPVPFFLLGLLVCVVQTLVWSLLSMVYISMATAHDH
jgi:F-type H+-transporting ATPase subunit a